jgi:MFS family permease
MDTQTRSAPVELGSGAKAYLRLLAYPPAAVPFIAAVIARLPVSMAPLGLLLLVEHERNAYSDAGFVTGAFAIGCAIGTPVWGRMMDRFGQVPTLLSTSLVSASFVAAVTLATISGAGMPYLIMLAACAGLSYPPMSPAIRTAWRVIFPDAASRRVAFALDATAVELLFVLGPLLLSGLLALTAPMVPLLVTAGCMIVGGVVYCRTPAARSSRPQRVRPEDSTPVSGRQHRSALTVPGVTSVLTVMLALSVGFGQLDTSLAGAAGELLGSNERVGIMFTAIAGGSAVGGLVFGSRNWALDERRGLPLVTGMFAILLASIAGLIAAGLTSLWLLLPLLFGTGLTIAPGLIMQQALLDHVTPTNRLNEAQSMLSAINMVGAAVGTALAGVVIDGYGLVWSFAGAAFAVAICCAVAVVNQASWARRMALTARAEAVRAQSGSAAG